MNNLLRKHRYFRRLLKSTNYNKSDKFDGSIHYWENRYVNGGNSGSGSYSELALFKAEVLNSFCEEHKIRTVIEFGCGDGNQLQLANYDLYIGLDVSKKAIEICREKFKEDSTKSFFYYDPFYFVDNAKIFTAELSVSLDVIFHLVEDNVFENYMNNLFNSAKKYVIIYSSNSENIENDAKHVRHRSFTDWIEKNKHEWTFVRMIENRYRWDSNNKEKTSFSNFFIFKK